VSTLPQLYDLLVPTSDHLRASEHPRAGDVEAALHVAARHVSTSRFGSTLHAAGDRDPRLLEDVLRVDGTTFETAVFHLVLSSATTALDLCAVALWFWVSPGATGYVDLADLRGHVSGAGLTLTPAQDAWLHDTHGSARYAPLKAFRHGHVHRFLADAVPSLDAGLGATPTAEVASALDPSFPSPESQTALLDDAAAFAEDRWRACLGLFRP
jgi:hypothetical protein